MTASWKLPVAAKRPRTTVPICLDGELAAHYAEAEQALALAKASAERADSLAGNAVAVQEAEQRLEELRAEMEPASVGFVVQAVGRKRWTELLAEHPPREGNAKDQLLGFNEDDMAYALVVEGIVEPKMTDGEKTELLDEYVSEGQFNELANAAYGANRRTVSVPFSSGGSRTPRSSGRA